MKKLFAVLLLLCSTGSLHAQDRVEGAKKLETPTRVLKPFLWKIEGDTPNYIFGTVHVADPRVLKLHPLAEKAFANADAALFEIDFQRANEQTAALSLPPNETIEDTLSDNLIRRLDQRFNKFGPGLRRQLKVRPVVLPMLIPQLEANRRFPMKPLDMQLYQRASREGKTVGGLENPGLQLRELFKMSKEEQSGFVKASLDAMDKADANNEDPLAKTINYYLRGDAKAFHKYFMDDLSSGNMPKPIQDKFVQGLLYSRNTRMAREIKELTAAFPDRKHFFAVGTAHMLGERSVLTELKKAGIKTTAVTE